MFPLKHVKSGHLYAQNSHGFPSTQSRTQYAYHGLLGPAGPGPLLRTIHTDFLLLPLSQEEPAVPTLGMLFPRCPRGSHPSLITLTYHPLPLTLRPSPSALLHGFVFSWHMYFHLLVYLLPPLECKHHENRDLLSCPLQHPKS